jgi:hypothetical protein
MEMRTIISHLIRNYTFDLDPASVAASEGLDQVQYGINRGTMGPADVSTPLEAHPLDESVKRHALGLKLRVTTRAGVPPMN